MNIPIYWLLNITPEQRSAVDKLGSAFVLADVEKDGTFNMYRVHDVCAPLPYTHAIVHRDGTMIQSAGRLRNAITLLASSGCV